jgi:ABC-type multidrug transport system permease subunit
LHSLEFSLVFFCLFFLIDFFCCYWPNNPVYNSELRTIYSSNNFLSYHYQLCYESSVTYKMGTDGNASIVVLLNSAAVGFVLHWNKEKTTL